jgi:tetratricopeptide (TPR) repeat protein
MARSLVFAQVLLAAGVPAESTAQYVGREACRGCHVEIYESQSKTGHAHALARARSGERGQWAFGAGEKATTWVSQADRDTYVEHGQSYFAATKSMGLTPGHSDANDARYRTFDPDATILRCFRCHATGPIALGPDRSVQPSEPGVVCETCHGPGGEHVRSKGAPGTLLNPARLSSGELNEFCGVCHRNGPANDWTDRWKTRHQPTYLNQAACFRKSNGALSCLTCHNPHAALSRRTADYDQRCTGCHKAARHRVAIAKKTCVECHMPQVAISAQLSFTNHWIGVYANGNSLVPARTTAGAAPPPRPAPDSKLISPADPATLQPLFAQALAEAEKDFGPDDLRAGRAASDLGVFLNRTGNAAEAETLLRNAVRIEEAAGEKASPADEMNLARVLAALDRGKEAFDLFQRAAAGSDPKVRAESFAALASLDPEHAEDYYRRALDAEEKAPVRNPRQIATILNNLAMERKQKEDYASAETLLRRALEVQRKEIGPESPAVAATLSNLGSLLETTGRHAEAAIRIFEKTLGPWSAELATSCANLADILATAGDRVQAASLYGRAIQIDESVYGLEHPEVAGDLVNLGLVLKESGRPLDARPVLQRALAIYEKAFGKNSGQAAQVRNELQ